MIYKFNFLLLYKLFNPLLKKIFLEWVNPFWGWIQIFFFSLFIHKIYSYLLVTVYINFKNVSFLYRTIE